MKILKKLGTVLLSATMLFQSSLAESITTLLPVQAQSSDEYYEPEGEPTEEATGSESASEGTAEFEATGHSETFSRGEIGTWTPSTTGFRAYPGVEGAYYRILIYKKNAKGGWDGPYDIYTQNSDGIPTISDDDNNFKFEINLILPNLTSKEEGETETYLFEVGDFDVTQYNLNQKIELPGTCHNFFAELIERNGKVYVELTFPYCTEGETDRQAWVSYWGTIDVDNSTSNGDDRFVNVGGQDIPYTEEVKSGKVQITKSFTNNPILDYDPASKTVRVTYTVTNRFYTHVSNPIFKDTFPAEATFVPGSLSIQYKGSAIDSSRWKISGNSGNGPLMIQSADGVDNVFRNGETFSYTYTLQYPESILKTLLQENAAEYRNYAYLLNSKGKELAHASANFGHWSYLMPGLDKSGSVNEKEQTITWTITWNPNGLNHYYKIDLNDINQSVLAKILAEKGTVEAASNFLQTTFGINPVITDTLMGDNQEFVDSTGVLTDGNGQPYKTFNLFELLKNNQLKYSNGIYRIEVVTRVKGENVTSNIFRNKASNGNVSVERQAGLKRTGHKKYVSKTSDGGSKVTWEYDVTVPGEGFESLVIEDQTRVLEMNNNYQESTQYKLVLDKNSIQIKTSDGRTLDIPSNAPGFNIGGTDTSFTFTFTPEFFSNNNIALGSEIQIFYKTTLTHYGQTQYSWPEGLQLRNEARASWNYGDSNWKTGNSGWGQSSTNTSNPGGGSGYEQTILKVFKEYRGNYVPSEKEFTITVQGPAEVAGKSFTGKIYNNYQEKETITVTFDEEGKYTFKTSVRQWGKSGVYIYDLPSGTYVISEDKDLAEVDGFTFTTTITDGGNIQFTEGHTKEATITNEYTKIPPSEWMKKTSLSSSGGQQRWQIQIMKDLIDIHNWQNDLMNGIEVNLKDLLPEGLTFAKEKGYIFSLQLSYSLGRYNSPTTIENAAQALSLEKEGLERFLNLINSYMEKSIEETNPGVLSIQYVSDETKKSELINLINSLKINSSNGTGEVTGPQIFSKIGSNMHIILQIEFWTKIEDLDEFEKLHPDKVDPEGAFHFSLTNSVSGIFRGEELGTAEGEAMVNSESIIHKTNVPEYTTNVNDYDYSLYAPGSIAHLTDSGVQNVFYSIVINPEGKKLSNFGDVLNVVDQMGADISILPGTVAIIDLNEFNRIGKKLYEDKSSLLKEGTYSWEEYPKQQLVVFTVPDSTPLVISYWARVDAEKADAENLLESSNTVQIYGLNNVSSSTSDFTAYAGKAGAYQSSFHTGIFVYKMDSSNQYLSGAEFSLTEVEYINGKLEDTGKVVEGHQSSIFGRMEFSDLDPKKIYLLKETKAPTGYNLLSKERWIYIIFKGYEYREENGTTLNYRNMIDKFPSVAWHVTTLGDGVRVADQKINPPIQFKAIKTMTGRKWLDSDRGAYAFMLTAIDGPLPTEQDNYYYPNDKEIIALNGIDSSTGYVMNVEFPQINFGPQDMVLNREYQYSYNIRELDPRIEADRTLLDSVDLQDIKAQSGVFYDTSQYKVIVKAVLVEKEKEDGTKVEEVEILDVIFYKNGHLLSAADQTVEFDNFFNALVVSKTVTGSNKSTDLNKRFEFTVTLSGEGASEVNGLFGDMEFTNGVANFTLRSGEFLAAAGLDPGLTYQVTEKAVDGFTTTSKGETGTIENGEISSADFTNNREPSNVSLILKKVLSSMESEEVEDDLAFTFDVILSGLGTKNDLGFYTYEVFGSTYESTEGTLADENLNPEQLVNGNWKFTFMLKPGQSLEISELPEQFTYEVTEQESESMFLERVIPNETDQERYTLLENGISGSFIKRDELEDLKLTFNNTDREDLKFELPTTGGNGSGFLLLIGGIALIAGMAVLVIHHSHKRRQSGV